MIKNAKDILRSAIRNLDDHLSKKYFKKKSFDKPVITSAGTPFATVSLEDLPSEAVESFQYYNSVEQTEYLYILNDNHIIESFRGWILSKDKKSYYEQSFPYSYLSPPPSFYNLFIKRNNTVHLKKVISLRYHFPNYWHFFNDALGQLAFINSVVDEDIPILVPAGVLEISFIKEIIDQFAGLKNRRWLSYPPNTIIEAETIIVAKNLPNTFKNFSRILDLLCLPNNRTAPDIARKIFIKRANNRGRYLSNSKAIEEVVEAMGFEIVDNDLLSFKEQLPLYQWASVVVGIHGAGFANLLFRYPENMHLIEIFPKDLIPPHYYWLCNELNFKYNCIIGADLSNGGFYLDPGELKNKLAGFLK